MLEDYTYYENHGMLRGSYELNDIDLGATSIFTLSPSNSSIHADILNHVSNDFLSAGSVAAVLGIISGLAFNQENHIRCSMRAAAAVETVIFIFYTSLACLPPTEAIFLMLITPVTFLITEYLAKTITSDNLEPRVSRITILMSAVTNPVLP